MKKFATTKELNDFYQKNTDRLIKIINPLPQCNYHVDIDISNLQNYIESLANDYAGLELNPDFQRGNVWTNEQEILYIENWVRGILGTQAKTLTFNCASHMSDKRYEPDIDKFYCLDGLQRYKAITRFVNGEFKVFGNLTFEDFNISRYSLSGSGGMVKIQIFNFINKKDMLEYYLNFNNGGTVHTKDEINRIKNMIKELN